MQKELSCTLAPSLFRILLLICSSAHHSYTWRRMVLEGPLFKEYFKKVEVSNFEVASDAFQTFKDLLTRHEPLVASYLQRHYDEVILLCQLTHQG